MTQWIVGLDYSMTCPAITIINRDGAFTFDRCQLHYISEKVEKNVLQNVQSARLAKYQNNQQRFDLISDWAVHSIFSTVQNDPVQIFIEGYSMGSKGRVFEIGENTGLLKHKLWRAGHTVSLIPPTVVKKHASGKGNSDKNRMYEAFVELTGVRLKDYYQPNATDIGSPTGDLVDSYYIAMCGWDGLNITGDAP